MSHPERFLMAGLMGWPVMHSRSPKIHNFWLAKYGLNGTYVPLAIRAEGLRAALRALPALGFAGCNLTIPHKEAAFEIVDRVDPLARRIGAINCVVVAADGSLDGYNYDGFGYIQSILEAYPNWRAAVAWKERYAALAGAAMLINTTSQGMAGQPALDLVLDKLPASALVSDIIYVPRETPLLAAARLRGNRTVNGLGMLLNQARPAFQAWFGVMPEVTAELSAMIEATI